MCEPRRFRIAVEKALYKEGMLVGQWQTMPVPAQDLFQSKLGYGGSSYPWVVNEAKGIHYDYDPNQFPVAQMLCDTYTIVHGVHAPNGKELMDKILAAFHKVFANLDQAPGPRRRCDLSRRGRQAVRGWVSQTPNDGHCEEARSLRRSNLSHEVHKEIASSGRALRRNDS